MVLTVLVSEIFFRIQCLIVKVESCSYLDSAGHASLEKWDICKDFGAKLILRGATRLQKRLPECTTKLLGVSQRSH